MKKLLFIICLLFQISLQAQKPNLDSIYENSAFSIGEKLDYEVKYGLIKGGEARMSIDLFPDGDSYVYHVKAMAITTGLAGKFARIYDIYESYIDMTTGYPKKASRNIRENNHTLYNEILFFREHNYVMSLNSGKHNVPYNTLDILSAFYYARRYLFETKLQKNETITLITFFEEKIFPIKIRYKETEKIRTKFGKIRCLKFVPALEQNSPFKKEKDLQVWFSDDGNYIPVKIKMNLPVGSVYAKLINYQNLKNDFGGNP